MPERVPEPKVTLTAYVPVEHATRLGALAQQRKMKRAAALARAIALGLDAMDAEISPSEVGHG